MCGWRELEFAERAVCYTSYWRAGAPSAIRLIASLNASNRREDALNFLGGEGYLAAASVCRVLLRFDFFVGGSRPRDKPFVLGGVRGVDIISDAKFQAIIASDGDSRRAKQGVVLFEGKCTVNDNICVVAEEFFRLVVVQRVVIVRALSSYSNASLETADCRHSFFGVCRDFNDFAVFDNVTGL